MNKVGLYAALGETLKQLPNTIFKRLKEQFATSITIYKGTPFFDVFEEWLYKNYGHRFRDLELSKGAFEDNTPQPGQVKKDSTLAYGFKEGYLIIKYEGKRILIAKNKETMSSNSRVFLDYYVLTSIDKDISKTLIAELEKEFNLHNTKIQLFSSTAWGEWEFIDSLRARPLPSIILDSTLKDKIVTDIDKFVASKEWYESVGIDYRRGYLFYGVPGNGKTSLSMALAQHVNRSIYAIDLASMQGDTELKRAFKNMKPNSILLMEDIDRAFINRDNSEVKGVSFSCLLNCLNGVFQKEGVITIMTTNHIEALDPALIRSGRVDMRVEIGNPSDVQINEYLTRFYGVIVSHWDYKSVSMADVQDICVRNKADIDAAIKELKG